jgi:hypothetical protein
MTASTATAPRRLRRPIRCTATHAVGFLALGTAAVVLLLAVAVGIYISQSAFQAGHQPTPNSAVQAFLDGALNDRRMSTVEKYLCSNESIHRKVGTIITGINQYTRQHPNTTITYDWDHVVTTARSRGHASVAADIRTRSTVGGVPIQAPAQQWTFRLANRSGWKICGLARS